MKKWICFLILLGLQNVYSQKKHFPSIIYQVKDGVFLLNIKNQQFLVPNFEEFKVFNLLWYKPTGKLYIFYEFIDDPEREVKVTKYRILGLKNASFSESRSNASKNRVKESEFFLEPPSEYVQSQLQKVKDIKIPNSFDTGLVVFAPYSISLQPFLDSDDFTDAYPFADYDDETDDHSALDKNTEVKIVVEQTQSISYNDCTNNKEQVMSQEDTQNIPEQKQENQNDKRTRRRAPDQSTIKKEREPQTKIPVIPYPEDLYDEPLPMDNRPQESPR